MHVAESLVDTHIARRVGGRSLGQGGSGGSLYLPNPDLEQLRATLAAHIIKTLDARGLRVRDAEKLTGTRYADFFRIRDTKFIVPAAGKLMTSSTAWVSGSGRAGHGRGADQDRNTGPRAPAMSRKQIEVRDTPDGGIATVPITPEARSNQELGILVELSRQSETQCDRW